MNKTDEDVINLAVALAPVKCIRPGCESPLEMAGEFEEVDNFEASRIVTCPLCKTTWWEVYSFSHIEII